MRHASAMHYAGKALSASITAEAGKTYALSSAGTAKLWLRFSYRPGETMLWRRIKCCSNANTKAKLRLRIKFCPNASAELRLCIKRDANAKTKMRMRDEQV